MNSKPLYACWTNKKYFDLWSVNHFLAGTLLGGIQFLCNFNFVLFFAFSLFLMIAWEVYEILAGVQEKWHNRVVDVLLGVVGFFFFYYLFSFFSIKANILIFTISAITWISLEIWGYMAYRKNHHKKRP